MGEDQCRLVLLGKVLLDAWTANLGHEKAAKTALLEGLAEVDANAVYVADRNQFDIVARALAELPLGALAELSVTAYQSPPARKPRHSQYNRFVELDREERQPPCLHQFGQRRPPRRDDPLRRVLEWGIRACDGHRDEGHKYFDYEDFVPDGGMDITPVVLSFGGADNQFLFWY